MDAEDNVLLACGLTPEEIDSAPASPVSDVDKVNVATQTDRVLFRSSDSPDTSVVPDISVELTTRVNLSELQCKRGREEPTFHPRKRKSE